MIKTFQNIFHNNDIFFDLQKLSSKLHKWSYLYHTRSVQENPFPTTLTYANQTKALTYKKKDPS